MSCLRTATVVKTRPRLQRLANGERSTHLGRGPDDDWGTYKGLPRKPERRAVIISNPWPVPDVYADERNYYKIEKWTKDGSKVDRMLYAGSNLDKAREVFQQAIKHRPRIRLTIRQRRRVLQQWPVI